MKCKASLQQRLRYAFENTLSAGTVAIIIWLAILSALMVVIFGLLYALTGIHETGNEDMSFFEALWQSLMRAIDPGTIAEDKGWAFRLISLLVTIGGIFILSTLIGALTSGLEDKFDELRKGRSKVLETNHTVILGWSPKIIHIISELIVANQYQNKARIVIMAQRDKTEMEDILRAKIPKSKNTRIICRTGNPLDITDLEIVNPYQAKSIIILSPENHDPDIYVIKSVLALTNNPKREKGEYHIVAEIKETANLEAAQLVGNNRALFVHSPEVIARVTAQTCRQAGLSIVYSGLLQYLGDEIYFKHEPSLSGKSYHETLFAYETSAVIGIFRQAGTIMLNPPHDTVIKPDDKILAISRNAHSITLSGKKKFEMEYNSILEKEHRPSTTKEKNIIFGWNERGALIIEELDFYVQKGSAIHILADDYKIESKLSKLQKRLKNQTVYFRHGDMTSRTTIENIDITSFDNVIILSNAGIDEQQADAKTLISLLHLRNIAEKKQKKLSIVSEMCDLKNRELAEIAKADDYIISDKLISLILAQLSETKQLNEVFHQLFEANGSEIYIKPIKDYVKTEIPVSFYTVIEAATRKGETAFGYRLMKYAYKSQKNYGIVVNPVKSNKVTFLDNDKIIVLAKD